MHASISNLSVIKKEIENKLKETNKTQPPEIIAVSKTFALDKIMPLIENGHTDFGENKVQEAIEKWTEIKLKKKDIKLHLIGKLQRNKVKDAVKIFDYIHSVDNVKLAKKISEEIQYQKKKIKIFLQVNIGEEDQKSGVEIKNLKDLYSYCISVKLDVIGLMCIPPIDQDENKYFSKMELLKKQLNLSELSMGMSADYLNAINYSSTYLRIGSSIFGARSK